MTSISIKISPFLFFLFFFCSNSFSQTYLRIEKLGSTKTTNFQIGDEIHFKLKDEDAWHSQVIMRLAEDKIYFENGIIGLDEIEEIRSYKGRTAAKVFQYKFYLFGGSFFGYSMVNYVLTSFFNPSVIIVPLIAISTGFIIWKIFKEKRYRMNKKHRLKIIDHSHLLKPNA